MTSFVNSILTSMDASLALVSFLVLCCGSLSVQFPQQDLTLKTTTASTSTDINSTDNDASSTVTVPCTTARGLPGTCMDRQYCDFSTYAIDLSLYAPKSYVKPCGDKRMCCPFGYQLSTEPTEPRRQPNTDDIDK